MVDCVRHRFPKRFEYDSASSGQRDTPHTDEQQQTQVIQKQLVRKLYRIEDARGVVNVQEGATSHSNNSETCCGRRPGLRLELRLKWETAR